MQEPLPIFRSTDSREAGVVGSTLRRRTRDDHPHRMVRLAPNAFVAASAWDAAGPRKQHVTRVHARLQRLGPHAVASHRSAAAVHGLPWLTAWPTDVHVTVPRSQLRRRPPGLVMHSRPIDDDEIDRSGWVRTTTMLRTAIDVALHDTRRESVPLLDAVLARGHSKSDLFEALDRRPTARGTVGAARAIDFADGRTSWASESFARVVFDEIGTPPPELQHVFAVDGHRYSVDFWFADAGVVVEIDGRAKYEQARYMDGRSPADVFIDEKRRHERLLTIPEVKHIVRLEWRDLWSRPALIRRLRAAGVPCRSIDELSACGLLVPT
jgi:hypothetical protein